MAYMIRRILLTALAGASLLLAADPTGTWRGDQPGRDGNTYSITFKLKADGAKLTIDLSTTAVPEVLGSARDLSLLVHNLIDNAIRYTKPPGKVVVDLRAEASQVILRVEDSGIGMTWSETSADISSPSVSTLMTTPSRALTSTMFECVFS